MLQTYGEQFTGNIAKGYNVENGDCMQIPFTGGRRSLNDASVLQIG